MAIVKTQPQVAVSHPHMVEWQILQDKAIKAMKSGLALGIKSPEQALIIGLKGTELGFGFMESFEMISVINGKPALKSQGMLALIYRRFPNAKITFKETTEKNCTVTFQRPGGDPQNFSFTMEEAKRAGLFRAGSAWEKYPAAMLRARAISAGARAVFPDCIMGCYTPEELGQETIDVEPVEAPTESKKETPQALAADIAAVGIKEALDAHKKAKENEGYWEDAPATEAQIKTIEKLLNGSKGFEFGEWFTDKYGGVSPDKISKKAAHEAIAHGLGKSEARQ